MLRASKIADRQGDRKMIIFGLFLMLISVFLLAIQSFSYIIASAICFFPGYMILTTLLPAGVTKLTEEHIRGTVTATFNTFQFLGSFAGSLITGLFWGIHPNFAIIALACVLVIILILQFSKGNRLQTKSHDIQ
jgi:MFS family permease